MAEDLVISGIRIDTAELVSGQRRIDRAISQIERDVKGLDTTVSRTSRTFSGFGTRVAAFAAAFLSLQAIGRASRFILDTNRELQDLEANLRTVTGSAGKATQVFRDITQFARETPFEIKGLTEAFVRLQAFGAGPTIDQFRGLGNISAAFSRDITGLSDAIISAVNTSIEPIRQFGVQAKISGDQMVVSFQGVQRTIPRTTEALTAFLAEMGNTGQFAGAMERRMDTLGGAMSNLTDTVTILAKDIGDQGLNREIINTIQLLDQAIGESDQFAQSIGQGAAGAVRLFRETLQAALPVMNFFAGLLASIGDQAGRIAAPELAAIAGIDNLADLDRRRSQLNRQLQVERARLDELNAQTPGGLTGFANRLLLGGRDEALGAQADEVNALIESLGALDRKRRELLDSAAAPSAQGSGLLGLGGGGKTAKEEIDPITQALERLEEELRGIGALRDALAGTGIEFDANAEAADAYRAALESVARVEGVSADLVAELAGNYVGLSRAVLQADQAERQRDARLEIQRRNAERQREFILDVRRRQHEMAEEAARQEMERQRELAEGIASSFADAFASVVTGTESVAEAFRQMVNDIISQLLRIQIQRAIIDPILQSLFPSPTPGPIDLGGPGGGLPGFAAGGSISAGTAAIVGERGPELFVPSTSGQIVPNHRMPSGGPKIENHFHNTYEIRAIDTRDLAQAVEQIAPVIARANAREVERSAAMRRRYQR